MSLEGRQKSRARIGARGCLTETLRSLLLPLSCGQCSRPWEAPCRGIWPTIKMAPGAMAFDGGAAGAHGPSPTPRNREALTLQLYVKRVGEGGACDLGV